MILTESLVDMCAGVHINASQECQTKDSLKSKVCAPKVRSTNGSIAAKLLNTKVLCVHLKYALLSAKFFKFCKNAIQALRYLAAIINPAL